MQAAGISNTFMVSPLPCDSVHQANGFDTQAVRRCQMIALFRTKTRAVIGFGLPYPACFAAIGTVAAVVLDASASVTKARGDRTASRWQPEMRIIAQYQMRSHLLYADTR